MSEDEENPYFGKKGEVAVPHPDKKKTKNKISLDSLKEICSDAIPVERQKPKEPDPLDW